jgi:hypothetical protein
MNQKSFLLSLFAAILLFGCYHIAIAQSNESKLPHSMKGYELYSWQTHKGWYFSLLVGTNRLKKYAEVISHKVRINGVAALKRKLGELPRGEEVFWSSERFRKMSLPPKEIVDELNTYCEQRGIKLNRAVE